MQKRDNSKTACGMKFFNIFVCRNRNDDYLCSSKFRCPNNGIFNINCLNFKSLNTLHYGNYRKSRQTRQPD